MKQPSEIPESGERLEFVPWSTFEAADRRVPVRWLLAAAIGVLVVVVAAVALAGLVRDTPAPAVAEPVTDSPLVPLSQQAPGPVAAPVPNAPATTLLSEADLRATQSVPESAIAAAAESFVFSYFTVDPARSTGAAAGMAAALDDADRSPTYVEWVRAGEISEVSSQRFDVLVRFRMMILGDPVERLDEAAVWVTVGVDPAGPLIVGPPVLADSEPVRIEAAEAAEYDGNIVAGPGGVPVLEAATQP